jgi:hypothetical protein
VRHPVPVRPDASDATRRGRTTQTKRTTEPHGRPCPDRRVPSR